MQISEASSKKSIRLWFLELYVHSATLSPFMDRWELLYDVVWSLSSSAKIWTFQLYLKGIQITSVGHAISRDWQLSLSELMKVVGEGEEKPPAITRSILYLFGKVQVAP